MGKGKKKHSKKDELTEDILDIAALSVKKFRKVTREIGKLSVGQKVAGSMALLAAGLTYLAKKHGDEVAGEATATGATGDDEGVSAHKNRYEEGAEVEDSAEEALSKSRKARKSK